MRRRTLAPLFLGLLGLLGLKLSEVVPVFSGRNLPSHLICTMGIARARQNGPQYMILLRLHRREEVALLLVALLLPAADARSRRSSSAELLI
jgi:hypothetical protein